MKATDHRRIIRRTTTNQTGNDHRRGTCSCHYPTRRTHRPTPERFTTGKYESRLHRKETTGQNESHGSPAALGMDHNHRPRFIRRTTRTRPGTITTWGTCSCHYPARRTHRPTPERFTTGKYEGRLYRKKPQNKTKATDHRRRWTRITITGNGSSGAPPQTRPRTITTWGTCSCHYPAKRTHRPTPERCTTGKYEGRFHRKKPPNKTKATDQQRRWTRITTIGHGSSGAPHKPDRERSPPWPRGHAMILPGKRTGRRLNVAPRANMKAVFIVRNHRTKRKPRITGGAGHGSQPGKNALC